MKEMDSLQLRFRNAVGALKIEGDRPVRKFGAGISLPSLENCIDFILRKFAHF